MPFSDLQNSFTGDGSLTTQAIDSSSLLVRDLTLFDATCLVVGGVIGSGIFLVPSIIGQQVGTPIRALAVWCLAGVLATFGALCFAELSSTLPHTGGAYTFLRESFSSKTISFFFCWSLLVAMGPATIAAVATAFALYSGYFVGKLIPYSPAAVKCIAIAAIAALTLVNYLGVRAGGKLQKTLTLFKLAALGSVVVAGLAVRKGSFTHLAYAGSVASAQSGLSAFGTAMIAALFAYHGWTYSTYVAGEVKNPARNVPLSIILGMTVVLLTYVTLNLIYMYALPFPEFAVSRLVAADAMKGLIGHYGGAFISFSVAISTLGTINAQILSYPRAFFAMSKDGMLFHQVGRVHPRFKTPSTAILLLGLASALFAVSGSYVDIFQYVTFIEYFFTALVVIGLIILRTKSPHLVRPYRVWGYPFTPLVFLLITGWYLTNTLTHSFWHSLVGIGLVGSGLPVYLLRSRHRDLP